MKMKAAISTSILGFVLAATPALAQQGMMGFANHDTDGDGVISSAEFAEFHEGVLAAADADENGMTLDEFLIIRMGPRPGANPDRQAAMSERAKIRKTERFHTMDVDGDNVVTTEEFTLHSEAMFSKADVDGDGLLTQAEFRQFSQNH